MKRFLCGILVFLAVITCESLAIPEPAAVQGPGLWTLSTEFEHPQRIILQRASDSRTMRFWYTIITLTNNTNDDVGFYPNCDLMTDTFQIIPAGKSVTQEVFKQIKQRHQRKYPFLELLGTADNKILQGEDNARDIAVIWPDFDEKAGNIKIFITGLSNETTVVEHPILKDQNNQPVKVFLRKTLELSYKIKGDPAAVTNVSLSYQGKRWIMR